MINGTLWALPNITMHVQGPVNVSQTTASKYEEKTKSSNAIGYGLAGTYYVTNEIQIKGSFEKTYRLPTERELFGDGDLEKGDADIKPENSRNVNLNITYNPTFNSIDFKISSINTFYILWILRKFSRYLRSGSNYGGC